MTIYALPGDVLVRLRRSAYDPGEQDQIAAWLDDAEVAIRARLVNLDQLVAAGTVSPDTLKSVMARAVARVALNPEGWRTEAFDEEWGPTRDQALSTGQVYISDDEWSQLMPWTSGAGLPQVFSLPMGTPCD